MDDILLADSQLDTEKRRLLGLGALSGFLAACEQSRTPLRENEGIYAKGSDDATGGVTDNASQNVAEVNSVGVDCNCTGDATPPVPPAAPGAPAPVAGPVNIPADRFLSLRPESVTGNRIGLSSGDLMGSQQTMSDGVPINVWRFTASGQGFNQDRPVPGPTIELIEGTPVELIFSTMHPHSIHLHGLDVDQLNDGVPSTSGYVVGMQIGGGGLPNGRVVGLPSYISPHSYFFTAPQAGTYMYHCHVDTVLHMEMGMYGAIVVRPQDGSLNRLWNAPDSPQFDREFVWHLHTFDSRWHGLVVSDQNTARYNPDYFLINGKDGVDLLTDPVTVLHAIANETVLVRAVNVGYMPAVISLGGIVFQVVSSDGRPLSRPITTTGFMVAPGERYDLLFTMPAAPPAYATVNYLNIRGQTISGGTATTLIIAV